MLFNRSCSWLFGTKDGIYGGDGEGELMKRRGKVMKMIMNAMEAACNGEGEVAGCSRGRIDEIGVGWYKWVC